MSRASEQPTDDIRRTLTVEEAGEMLGISRWLAYEQAKTGEIAGVPVLRVGRRLLVPRVALERVLSGEPLTRLDSEEFPT